MSRQKPTRLAVVPEPGDRPVTHESPPPHKRPGIERLEAAVADAAAAASLEIAESRGRRKFRDQGPTPYGPHQRRGA